MKHPLLKPHFSQLKWMFHRENSCFEKSKEYLLKEFADVFQGVWSLPGPLYHIRLKENYTPVQHPPWSVPVGM